MTDEPTYHVQITADDGPHGSLDLPIQLQSPPAMDADGELLVPINPHKLTPASKRAMRTIVFTFVVFFAANVLAFKAYQDITSRRFERITANANAKAITLARLDSELAKKVALHADAKARCEAWDEVHVSNQITFGPYSSAGLTATGKQVRENFNAILAARIVLLNAKLGPRPPC